MLHIIFLVSTLLLAVALLWLTLTEKRETPEEFVKRSASSDPEDRTRDDQAHLVISKRTWTLMWAFIFITMLLSAANHLPEILK